MLIKVSSQLRTLINILNKIDLKTSVSVTKTIIRR